MDEQPHFPQRLTGGFTDAGEKMTGPGKITALQLCLACLRESHQTVERLRHRVVQIARQTLSFSKQAGLLRHQAQMMAFSGHRDLIGDGGEKRDFFHIESGCGIARQANHPQGLPVGLQRNEEQRFGIARTQGGRAAAVGRQVRD